MRFRVESLSVPGLVLADDVGLRSPSVRGGDGKVVEDYCEPAALAPGRATVLRFTVPGEDGERSALFVVRRLADDPLLDPDLDMPTLALSAEVRSALGPESPLLHVAPGREGPRVGGRRRRSQAVES